MIGFDFEVFNYDWLVVFKDFFSGMYHICHNDKVALEKFIKENQDKLFVGFNNNNYDNYILKGILLDINPQILNAKIMRDEQLWSYAEWNTIKITTYDVSFGLGYTSLKENEAYLGISIDETPVDFNLPRELNDSERDLVIEYCKRDVDATEILFRKTKSSFEAKLMLLKEFGLGRGYLSKSNNRIIEKVLGASKKPNLSDDNLGFDFSQLDINIPIVIQRYFEQPIDQQRGLSYTLNGVEHIFGIGGIHGATPNFKYVGELWLLDVTSYYPSLMIEYDWFSRAIPDKKKKLYAQMKSDRVELKKSDPRLADAYKLVLNSTYGAYKYQYGRLYDPRMANNIVIAGQCMIVDLVLKLEPYCKLIQSNTDGIIIIPNDPESIKEIVKDWEKRTRMTLEIVKGRKIVQKDVNNYVFEHEYGVDVAGGYVRQYKPRGIRNNMAVVDKALVNYLLTGVSIEDYINNNNDIIDYQIISKVGKTYDYVWFRGEKVNFVNRVFASYEDGKLYKQKKGGNLEMVANQPDKSLLWNDDVNKMSIDKIDKTWYIEVANKRLEDYIGE